MNKSDNNKLELQVYMADNLEFKDIFKAGALQLHELKFIPLESIILGDEKSKKLIEICRNAKLKITIEREGE